MAAAGQGDIRLQSSQIPVRRHRRHPLLVPFFGKKPSSTRASPLEIQPTNESTPSTSLGASTNTCPYPHRPHIPSSLSPRCTLRSLFSSSLPTRKSKQRGEYKRSWVSMHACPCAVRGNVHVRIPQDARIDPRLQPSMCISHKGKSQTPQITRKHTDGKHVQPEYNLHGPNLSRDLRFFDSVRDPGVHWQCHWVRNFVV